MDRKHIGGIWSKALMGLLLMGWSAGSAFALPDFEVLGMSLELGMGTPVPTCVTTPMAPAMKVTLRNNGPDQSNGIGTYLQVTGTGGSQAAAIPAMAAGTQLDIWLFSLGTAGSYTAIADFTNGAAETDEGNNILAQAVTAPAQPPFCGAGTPTATPSATPPNPSSTPSAVPPAPSATPSLTPAAPAPSSTATPAMLPDFEVLGMSLELVTPVPSCVTTPLAVALKVTLRNNGPAQSSGVGTYLQVSGTGGTQAAAIPAMAAGTQVEIWLSSLSLAGGYIASADFTNGALETDEGNNTLALNVTAPAQPPLCGSITPTALPTATPLPGPCGGKVKAYPNPAKKHAHFSWTMPSTGQAVLTLRTANGRLVAEKAAYFAGGPAKMTLQVSQLPRGVYLYNLALNLGSSSLPKFGCGQLVKR